jgi:D-glycero-alpha-D-manno-heptose 1-phosphate guanylyltransferase
MHAIILAGGQGQRLRPLVRDVPKPLAPIDGRPFLAYLLDLLERQGVTDVILAVGYLGEQIEGVFGSHWGKLALRYSVEREPLGTGGALRQALGMIERYPAFALNGDTYIDLDMQAMRHAHSRAKSRLTVAVRREAPGDRYGRVEVEDGRIVGFASGPQHTAGLVNCGVYLFAENLLADLALTDRFSFENDFLAGRVRTLRPLAFETSGYFIDIGIPEDFVRAQRELPAMDHKPVAR